MKKVYLLPGIGANKSIFDYLTLPPNYEKTCIEWIDALKDDDFESYAQRISELITDDEPIIIGVSMGGMIASEIAKHRKVKQLILISSAENKSELPIYSNIKPLKYFIDFIPFHKFTKTNKWVRYQFGVQTKEQEDHLAAMMKQSNHQFIKWGLKAIGNWKNKEHNKNIIFIHGDKDRIIPLKNKQGKHIVKGAGHMLVTTHHKEMNEMLKKYLP